MTGKRAVLLGLLSFCAAGAAGAAGGGSATPYIDSIREGLKEREGEEGAVDSPSTDENPDPYLKKLREAMSAEEGASGSRDPAPAESFIEGVKSSERFQEETRKERAPGAFIESVRDGLAPKDPKEAAGAIEAYRSGQSDLELKRSGEIHHAASIRYGALMSRSLTAASGAGARTFAEVYGTHYTPSLSVTYEYQPWHSEWLGSLGIQGGLGAEYTSGSGVFRFALTNPVTGQPFSSTSRTVFGFLSVPLTLGLNYRMNLARILRPFAAASALAVGYVEARGDQGVGAWKRGFSLGFAATGGVNLLLDWFSRGGAWDLYANYGIQHTYLTASYDLVGTFFGDVTYAVSGVQAGLTFEF